VTALQAQVIASDARTDVALLCLPVVPDGIQELQLATTGCGPGDDVHSVGNAGLRRGLTDGTLWWYTRGCVRQVYTRPGRKADGVPPVRMVETQSPVNQGDSSGPVVDDEGRLVGVTDSYTAGERLVSQTIDLAEVREFLKKAPPPATLKAGEKGPTLRGGWMMRVEHKGDFLPPGKWEFRADGTFLVSSKGTSRIGRYAHINGVLWLICDEVIALASPVWSGVDQFTLKADDVNLVFERVTPRRAIPAAEKAGRASPEPGAAKSNPATGERAPRRLDP
jgi:hypothetical protein